MQVIASTTTALNVVLGAANTSVTEGLLADARAVDVDHTLCMRHASVLRDGRTWDTSLLLLTHDMAALKALSESWQARPEISKHVMAIDIMQVQRNVDMLLPHTQSSIPASRMLQWIEYVFTRPEHKAVYYQQQYDFSGPAMKRLWDKDRCSRFIGFELRQRIYQVHPAFPRWDVIHIVGFTPWQMIKSLPAFLPAWNAQARACYGDEKRRKIIWNEEWPRYREVLKHRAFQAHSG
ncbi:MAG: hypothetical protein AAGI11_21925 [Pseudomonadota bacterium]